MVKYVSEPLTCVPITFKYIPQGTLMFPLTWKMDVVPVQYFTSKMLEEVY